MKQILKTYWNIILLRGHAYELPYQPLLPVFWICLDLVIVLVLSLVMQNTLMRDMMVEIADVGLTATALYFILWYYKRVPRFIQAYSAILGVGSLFLIVLATMVLLLPFGPVIGVFSQLSYLWIMIVFVLILKDTLDVTVPRAILWLVGIELVRFLLITQLLKVLS